MGEMSFEIESKIKDLMTDLVAALLYYDRKGDETTPVGMIEALIHAEEITEDQIVAQFAAALHLGVTEGR